MQQTQNKNKKKDVRLTSVYSRCLITRNISLPMTMVGKNIEEIIEKKVVLLYEGKCVVEGYIKLGSIKIITFSSGIIAGNNIRFQVVFECQVCCPVEGMLVTCVAKNITKAGIRAESVNETPTPFVVFVARDHYYNQAAFSKIQEGDTFTARVIGQRFELNDKYISIIAEVVIDKPLPNKVQQTASITKPKHKLVIQNVE